MDRCPIKFETLADYHEGRTDAAETARIAEHLAAGCPSCERALARLQRTLGALRESRSLQHAPAPALARARALFRERNPAPAPPVRRPSVLAQLIFDSRSAALPTFAMARGEESASVQLLFRTAEHDIDLWQERRDERSWYLIGQVLPRSEDAPAAVPESAVLEDAGGAAIPAVPEGSEFHLPAVPPGRYQLRLGLAGGDVLVPDVDVGL